MKSLFFSLIFIITTVCVQAQKIDSCKTCLYVPNLIQGYGTTGVPNYTNKLDTVQCIMLIADTSFYAKGNMPFNQFNKAGNVYWVSGYVVKEAHSTSEGVIDPGFYGNQNWQTYYIHKEYLDAGMKKIAKNVIVFMSIETNKR